MCSQRPSWAILLACIASAVWLQPASVQAADPVAEGRQALRRSGSYPWYDAGADDVRVVSVREEHLSGRDKNRFSDWETQPKEANWNWGTSFPELGDLLLRSLESLFLLLIVVLLVLAVWWLLRTYWRTSQQAAGEQTETVSDVGEEVDRVEQLPFRIEKPTGDLLGEARHCYERGDYRMAMVYLFSYMLVQLDRYHWIHLEKGKTNRQYLRELARAPGLSRLFEPAMEAFEDVFFGDHDLARDDFESHWTQLDQFHRVVQEGATA